MGEEGGSEFGAVGGAMEEKLRCRGWEKVVWRPRGMNGVLGGGTMSYGRICLINVGGVTVLPLPLGFWAWVCVLRVGDSRVTLLLPK